MRSLKHLLFILLLIGLCNGWLTAGAQQTAETFVQKTDYLLSLPAGYSNDTTQRWPLVIFLHGSGESGHDVEKVKAHGPPKLVAAGKQFPFILVSPQAQRPPGWEPENLYRLLLDIKSRYRVDNDRVYLTGLSMGGFGTWALAMKHPEEFAALIPICGGGDTSDAWKLRHIPIWCFHGALDKNVPVVLDSQMVRAAGQYNPSVRLTVYPDLEHNSWERTYNNDSVYQWMLAQRKFAFTEKPVSDAALKAYAGVYAAQDGDTVVIGTETGGLNAKTRKGTIPLKSSGGDAFFINMHEPVEVIFQRDAKGRCNAFQVLENKKTLYRKI